MKLTNKKGLPQEFVDSIKLYRPKSERMSTTHLIDEPLIRTLMIEKWDDIEVDASDFVLMMLGISFHKSMENEADEHSEHKYEDKIDGLTLVGKADLYNSETKIISDWKVTSVWTIIFGDRIKEWEKQLNIYAYQHRKRNLSVEKLQIHCILRDWSKTKAEKSVWGKDDYPKDNFVTINIPLWTFEEQEKYIKDQIHFHTMNPRGECSSESKWQKPDKYAVMKDGRKSAMRVLDTLTDAQEWAKAKTKMGGDIHIVKRPGECTRCVGYCTVKSVCPYVGGK